MIMRFNKKQLSALFSQPRKFEKEGVLFVQNKSEGFLENNKDLSYSERWCGLHGNLFFYFENEESWSSPLGLIVLDGCIVNKGSRHCSYTDSDCFFGFYLVFNNGSYESFGATSATERGNWMDMLKISNYAHLQCERNFLQQQLYTRLKFKSYPNLREWRLKQHIILDIMEPPIAEISLECEGLLCDVNGCLPTTVIFVEVYMKSSKLWVQYDQTEYVVHNCNPTYIHSMSFRASDGISLNSHVKFKVCRVTETMSNSTTLMSYVIITLTDLCGKSCLRVALKGPSRQSAGFLSIKPWVQIDKSSVTFPTKLDTTSCLSRLKGLNHLCASPKIETYKIFDSGVEVFLKEYMAESRYCFTFPYQLLNIWIAEELDLIQNIFTMGPLVEPWDSIQLQVLNVHLNILKKYTHSRENFKLNDAYFKPSSKKTDLDFEFSPVNLHLQRFSFYTNGNNKSNIHDWITVGAFTAHCNKAKSPGLIKSLPELNNTTSLRFNNKRLMVNEYLQISKLLKKEISHSVDLILEYAAHRRYDKILLISEHVTKKVKLLLFLWDENMLEDAVHFLESYTLPNISKFDNIDVSDLFVVALEEFQQILEKLPYDNHLHSNESSDENTCSRQLSKKQKRASGENNKLPLPIFVNLQNNVELFTTTHKNIEASIRYFVRKVKLLFRKTSTIVVWDGNLLPSSYDHYKKSGKNVEDRTDYMFDLKSLVRKLEDDLKTFFETVQLTYLVCCMKENLGWSERFYQTQYRRDVCFSQSLTSLVTALMSILWCQEPSNMLMIIMNSIGPLVYFEGLLSYHGNEIDMWNDMSVAIKDLKLVTFTLERCSKFVKNPTPTVCGRRNSLTVLLPIPEILYYMIPNKNNLTFQINPVFFNVGINEEATISEKLNGTGPQRISNIHNFCKLKKYFNKFKALTLPEEFGTNGNKNQQTDVLQLTSYINELQLLVHSHQRKNVGILNVTSKICHHMHGFHVISCKSAKDRTGMAITLHQLQVLDEELKLKENDNYEKILDCMRSEGCRRYNVLKNTNVRKYAFTHLQRMALPKEYRPPVGSYGTAET